MTHRAAIGQHLLVYDGDCAFCTLWVQRLQRWLPRFPPTTTSQALPLDTYALSQEDVDKFAWYLTPTHHYAGHLAASALLRVQPRFTLRLLGWILAIPPMSWVAAGVYSLVARYRGLLPGGTATCDPALNQK